MVTVGAVGHYFLGSIIISEKEGKKYLIDGQQRLTTVTLLLNRIAVVEAVRTVLAEVCAEESRSSQWRLCGSQLTHRDAGVGRLLRDLRGDLRLPEYTKGRRRCFETRCRGAGRGHSSLGSNRHFSP